MAEKILTLVLKVDLNCAKCYNKMRKTLCQFHYEIHSQTIDKKHGTIIITGHFDPQTFSKKLNNNGGKVIKGIEIKQNAKKEEEKPKPKQADAKPDKPKQADAKPDKPQEVKAVEKPKKAEEAKSDPPKQATLAAKASEPGPPMKLVEPGLVDAGKDKVLTIGELLNPSNFPFLFVAFISSILTPSSATFISCSESVGEHVSFCFPDHITPMRTPIDQKHIGSRNSKGQRASINVNGPSLLGPGQNHDAKSNNTSRKGVSEESRAKVLNSTSHLQGPKPQSSEPFATLASNNSIVGLSSSSSDPIHVPPNSRSSGTVGAIGIQLIQICLELTISESKH
ncbi:hypothetical protein IFM89_021333 [Coptis chinensis]|uniref:HMA domain-containing protein n=1 Tax=Coptis chinensis TaxID=261450 RepID=A0A835LV11_9MAGN|nr:hypothetical protein IFM89_021333 [Coptis chinensis]